jgi:subtilase family serine protease
MSNASCGSKALVRAFSCAVLITAVLSSVGYAVTPDRISGALNSGPSVALRGNVHPLAVSNFDVGPADPAMRFGTIMLHTTRTASQQKAINQLLAEQQNRKSANYHKWLTPEQYADRFGLSPNDVKKITTWLNEQGFTGVQVARGRDWVMFSGSAAQVKRAFGTEIHRFNVNGEMHVANATAPKIPAALAGIVAGIRGLHDFHPKARAAATMRPLYASASGSGFPNQPNVLAPGDIAAIYDINSLYAANIDGTGEAIAVIGQSDIYFQELADFRAGFGLSPISCGSGVDPTTGIVTACSDPHFRYVVIGTDPVAILPASQRTDVIEEDLGIEWAGAVARGAQIIYVNSPTNGTSNGDATVAWEYAVDQILAPVISMSFGNCEFFVAGIPGVAGQTEEQELQKANTEGITFVSASGDGGPAGCDPFSGDPNGASAAGGLAVTWPASAPEVTAVGGTSMSLSNLQSSSNWGTTNDQFGGSATGYITEQAWNDDEEYPLFCAQFTGNLFCSQGGPSPGVTGWHNITDAVTAQQDVGLMASGGGASNCATQSANPSCVSGFSLPSYQSKLSVNGFTNVANPARMLPDVAMLASSNFPGYIFCSDQSLLFEPGSGSTCTPTSGMNASTGISNALALKFPPIIGGTSAATPVFAGIVALLDQYMSSWQGQINSTLYTLAATPANGVFHQVISGNNTVVCTPGTPSTLPVAFQCPAGGTFGFDASVADPTTGYNVVTGLGSIDAKNLLTSWAAAVVPAAYSLSATALSPASVTAGGSATSTVTLTVPSTTINFGGTVTFGCTGLPTGATCSFSPATATTSGATTLTVATTASTPSGGPTTITVTGTTASGVSYTTGVSLTVTGGGASFSLSTGNTTNFSVTQGSAVDVPVTVTLASGFTGTVTFSCSDPASESTCTPPAATNASGKVSFHITTTAASASLIRPFDRDSRTLYAVLLPGLFGIVFTLGSRKRSLRGMRMLGLIMVLGVSAMWLGSCGGSSNKSTSNPGTPKGQYTIGVTGTSGNSTAKASFTVTVQ